MSSSIMLFKGFNSFQCETADCLTKHANIKKNGDAASAGCFKHNVFLYSRNV